MCGSPRSCITSTSIACGRRIGRLSPKAAPGVDGVTWRDYGLDLEANLRDLHARVHRGAYRARPSRRVFIPKPDGRQRPLGVAALEDKILQRAVVEVLNAIYETDFLGFSYGFRPGRSPHHALDALAAGIDGQEGELGARRGYPRLLLHARPVVAGRFLEHRIADRRVLRLIQKWLSAGVIEDGEWSETEEGTAQGASVSPLLANVYLALRLRPMGSTSGGRHARGDVIIVRFADDFVVGFEHREDAERFLADLRGRFAQFGLELTAEKTRLIEFGRFAAQDRRRRGDRQATHVHVPGVHAHLRDHQVRTVQAQAGHEQGEDAGQAQVGQGRADATPASPDPRARALARQRPARALQLLRGARQQRCATRLPRTDHPALATGALAPQPERPHDPGADAPSRTPMATHPTHPAPLARGPLRRPTQGKSPVS